MENRGGVEYKRRKQQKLESKGEASELKVCHRGRETGRGRHSFLITVRSEEHTSELQSQR